MFRMPIAPTVPGMAQALHLLGRMAETPAVSAGDLHRAARQLAHEPGCINQQALLSRGVLHRAKPLWLCSSRRKELAQSLPALATCTALQHCPSRADDSDASLPSCGISFVLMRCGCETSPARSSCRRY